MERAILVTIVDSKTKGNSEIYQEELRLLAKTALLDVCCQFCFELKRINPAFYISKGKLEHLVKTLEGMNIDVVVFGVDLRASQQRNIETVVKVKTIDYTQLILDIFARHAKSLEGKMQVELAQLEYLLPRLSGKGILLSRLGGGIGTRGPGETKLEVDRRRISQRVSRLKKQLEKYRKHRAIIRKSRKRHNLPQVSLVGYTSAGKSTLLNAITSAEQQTSSALFTTLDPLSRKIRLLDGRSVVISDTVGFIDRLPHTLVEAFKATLEELVVSDLLLFVIDGSDVDWERKERSVFRTLDEIGCGDKEIIMVVNKIDVADKEILRHLKQRYNEAVFISALKKEGLEQLILRITKNLKPNLTYREVFIPYNSIKKLDVLYKTGKVVERQYIDTGIIVKGYFDYKFYK